jgi:hypothetical protein
MIPLTARQVDDHVVRGRVPAKRITWTKFSRVPTLPICRSAGRAAAQIPASHQFEGSQKDWPANSCDPARPRRQSHRMNSKHPAGPPMTLGNMRATGLETRLSNERRVVGSSGFSFRGVERKTPLPIGQPGPRLQTALTKLLWKRRPPSVARRKKDPIAFHTNEH